MKKFIIAPVAAVVMLGLSGTAFAQDSDQTGVDIYKRVSVTNKMDYKGTALIGGTVGINQLGMAVIDSYQNTSGNNVTNNRNENSARISDGSGTGLSGNMGLNVSAGDNNVQANNTAMTVLADVEFDKGEPSDGNNGNGNGQETDRPTTSGLNLFGGKGASVDAEIGTGQVSTANNVSNRGNHNNANISGGSLNGAAGNLGANVAAGSGNAQVNNFALSYGEKAHLAVSTVDNKQFTTGNNTTNQSLMDKTKAETVKVKLSGNISGEYTGKSAQSNDVYPEIWYGGSQDTPHPDGNQYAGHIDFDDKNPNKPGRFEFEESGTIDLGKVSLSGKLATINHTVGRMNVNNASISGGSLNNAAGNIGVNVAAGTNNLQSNSMALSVGNL
ncbi:hypothetical protein [Oceanisphaera avium]|uniref:Heme utilization protein n=1 Tax=Oceanisphaera avium TaxID=1903694 RepID=A0A1Y0CY82_9GAMM|nr:hypothetical protein [Oceanisphaera avium]ART80282.1 hypothetical protein CBP12_09090 [Oceanisphaera avium]